MFSKLALLIQGLLVMVILISSIGEARNLVEVATKQNNVDGIKYCMKTNGKDNVDASSDCFIPDFPGIPGIPFPYIPGIPFPKIPGIPGFPFPFPGIPGWPDIPGWPNPSIPKAPPSPTPRSPSPSPSESPSSPSPSESPGSPSPSPTYAM